MLRCGARVERFASALACCVRRISRMRFGSKVDEPTSPGVVCLLSLSSSPPSDSAARRYRLSPSVVVVPPPRTLARCATENAVAKPWRTKRQSRLRAWLFLCCGGLESGGGGVCEVFTFVCLCVHAGWVVRMHTGWYISYAGMTATTTATTATTATTTTSVVVDVC